MGFADALCLIILVSALTVHADDSCLTLHPTPMIVLTTSRSGGSVLASEIASLTNASLNIRNEPFGNNETGQIQITLDNPDMVAFIQRYFCAEQKDGTVNLVGFTWRPFLAWDNAQMVPVLHWIAKNSIKVVVARRNALDRLLSIARRNHPDYAKLPFTCRNSKCVDQAKAVKVEIRTDGLPHLLRYHRAQSAGVQNALDKAGVLYHIVDYGALFNSNASTKLGSWHKLLTFLDHPRKTLYLADLVRGLKSLPTTPRQAQGIANYRQVVRSLKGTDLEDLLH